MRTVSLLAFAALFAGAKAAVSEGSALVQAAISPTGEVGPHTEFVSVKQASDDTWDFDLKALQDLLDSFDVQKIKDQLQAALKDPEKLAEFANKFSERLQASVTKTEEKLKELQDQAKTAASAAKAKALLEITDKVSKFGRAAQHVAEQLTEKVEEAQSKLREKLQASVEAKAAEKVAQFQKALDAQIALLNGLVEKLKLAMHRIKKHALIAISVPDDLSKVVAAAGPEVEVAWKATKHILEEAKTYIAFVNKTLNEVEAKAVTLSNATLSASGDKADKHIDQLTQDLLTVLQMLNQMLGGELSFAQAKAYLKSSSHKAFVTPSALAVLVFVAAGLMGRD